MKKNGFTMIELIMSIFIITLGGGAAFSLIQQNFNLWLSASSRLQAVYMAQEALEVARNIRDGNYLEQRTNPAISWDDGIPSPEGCLATPVPPCDYYGDVDADGIVSSNDALLIAEYRTGTGTLEDFQKERADVDSNGIINMTDTLFINQYAMCSPIRPTFGVCGTSKAKFQRTVSVTKPTLTSDTVDVLAKVSWSRAGQTQMVSILDKLTEWR